jgi:hypothetical protein
LRQSFVTINWKGKFGRRGLTETSLEILRDLALRAKTNGSNFQELVDKLEKDYSTLIQQSKIFDLQEEIHINSKYVRVLL